SGHALRTGREYVPVTLRAMIRRSQPVNATAALLDHPGWPPYAPGFGCKRGALDQLLCMEIHVLHRQGASVRRISRRLGLSRNTVRRYLRSSDPLPVT